MSHEHHHHHHRDENTETENYAAATDVVYGDDSSGYGNVPVAVETTEVVTTTANLDDGSIAETHKRTHKREEVVGGLGTLAAGAFALVIYIWPISPYLPPDCWQQFVLYSLPSGWFAAPWRAQSAVVSRFDSY